MGDVRCPACDRRMAVITDDFAGSFSSRCDRSGTDFAYPPEAEVEPVRLTCLCGKWLASGRIDAGAVRLKCRRCKGITALTADGPVAIEPGTPPVKRKRPGEGRDYERRRPFDSETLVAQIEERWQARRYQESRRSVEVAVGLRFDVFARDGFRCRYCGRGPEQGVFLEADHVIARANGGADTLANLVTACWDCNRGKSAKVIAS